MALGRLLCSLQLGNLARGVQRKPCREGHVASNLEGEAGPGGSRIISLNKEDPKYPRLWCYRAQMCLHTQGGSRDKATSTFRPRVVLSALKLMSNLSLGEICFVLQGFLCPWEQFSHPWVFPFLTPPSPHSRMLPHRPGVLPSSVVPSATVAGPSHTPLPPLNKRENCLVHSAARNPDGEG